MAALKRVVVTGRGCVSPLGPDRRAFEAALREGRSAIGPVPHPDGPLPLKLAVGARVAGFDPSAHFEARRLPLLDVFTQFALVAAREAVAEAGLGEEPRQGAAVVIGTGAGGQAGIDAMLHRTYVLGKRIDPLAVPRVMGSAPVSHIAAELGARGPAFGVTSACASSAHAVGTALLLLRSGAVEVALAGGSDASFSYGHVQAWHSLRVMAPDTCRPFSRDRRGMVLGEGAGVFVLETLEHARRRGAAPLAELAGVGQSSDAGDPVHPDPAGMAAALTGALCDAGLAAGEVDYVNAHGTGTPSNDVAETRALRQALGAAADRVSVSATKSLHGHALGASGALELVATLFAVREGLIPPTANWLGPDPDCDLDVTPNVARERPVRAALSSSFAFGGLNAVLAVRRFEGWR